MSFQSRHFRIGPLSSSPRHQPLLPSCPGCWHFVSGHQAHPRHVTLSDRVMQPLRTRAVDSDPRAGARPTPPFSSCVTLGNDLLRMKMVESLLHGSLVGLTEIRPVRCWELNAQKSSVMLLHGGWIIVALLQACVTTAPVSNGRFWDEGHVQWCTVQYGRY